MDQDRWKTINHIFHAALEVSSSERQAYVLSASHGDQELQAEVELLLKADEDAGDYLESPLMPADLFTNPDLSLNPGDVLCERFRILRAVGQGGMGHVFEAYDSELAVRVALKIIRPEIASNPEALTRFRQEVRLARRITHPNVCRTFDIDRETRVVDPVRNVNQEVVFLTMEFLEGETLDSRIKRIGSLPLEEALHVARQIADALAAAHAMGIVHRDMKPANIMLVPAESPSAHGFRAVVTDFGLAHLDTALPQTERSAFTHSGRPIGTLSYMAPEQLDGKSVSAATDIYALGLILFEMVTGARAFPSEGLLSGIARRLNGPPPSPQAIVPTLPVSWCSAIERCLRLKPQDRLQSATDAIAILDGSRTNPHILSQPSSVRRTIVISWLRFPRIMALAGIFSVIVALFFVVNRLYRSSADSKIVPGALVYLTEVKNLTGEGSFNNVTELLQVTLSQSAQFNLLDQSRVGDALHLMTEPPDTKIDETLAREIAMRTGAIRVIFASLNRSGGRYQLHIDIQEPDATSPSRYREHWQESFEWQASSSSKASATVPAELLRAVRNSSDWIRNKVGESANDIARLDVPPEDVTTGNWKALADFAQAKRFLRENRPEDAVNKLKEATQADAHFSLAYASMGDVLVSLHRDLEGYAAYDEGLDTSLQSRLSSKEEDRIRGMRAADRADYELAVDAFHDLAVNYPTDVAAWVYPTFPLRMLNRDEQAISNLRRAIALDPDAAFAPYALAQELMIVGRLQEVPQWISYLKAHRHGDAAAEDEAALALLNHRYDQAERIFQSTETSSSAMQRSYSYQELASVQAETGHLTNAIETLNQGIVEDKSQSNTAQQAAKLLARAYLECKLRRFESCLQDAHSGFTLNPTPESASIADTVLGQAVASAPQPFAHRIGFEFGVVARSVSAGDYGRFTAYLRLRTQGEIQLADGTPRLALRSLEKAALQDAPAGDREYLARALVAVAGQEPVEKTRREFLQRAEAAYAVVALKPAFIFCNVMNSPPGLHADETGRYLWLAEKLNDDSPQVRNAQLEYVELLRQRSEPNNNRISSDSRIGHP